MCAWLLILQGSRGAGEPGQRNWDGSQQVEKRYSQNSVITPAYN